MKIQVNNHKPKVIVGIDPGFTSGLAIIDLEGNLIFVGSIKDAGREVLIKEITRYGEPVLISTDVYPTPEFIKKIAATFDSPIYTPIKSLSIDEKRQIVNKSNILKQYNTNRLDLHAQDAFAAALKAFKKFRNKFEKIDETIRSLSSDDTIQEVKTQIMRGYAASKVLRSIISGIGESKEELVKSVSVSAIHHSLLDELNRLRDRISKDEATIHNLTKEAETQRNIIKELNEKNRRLLSLLETEKHRSIAELRKESLYRNQVKQIKYLQECLQEANLKIKSQATRSQRNKRFEEIEKGGLIFLKPIGNFTEEGVENAVTEMGIKKGDPLIILNAAGGGAATANKLVELKPRFVVTCTAMSHQAEERFEKGGIPIFNLSELQVKNHEGFSVVSMQELVEKLELKKDCSEVFDPF